MPPDTARLGPAVIRAVYDLKRYDGSTTIWPTSAEIAKYLETDEAAVLPLLRNLRDQRLFRDRTRRGRRVWMPWEESR